LLIISSRKEKSELAERVGFSAGGVSLRLISLRPRCAFVPEPSIPILLISFEQIVQEFSPYTTFQEKFSFPCLGYCLVLFDVNNFPRNTPLVNFE